MQFSFAKNAEFPFPPPFPPFRTQDFPQYIANFFFTPKTPDAPGHGSQQNDFFSASLPNAGRRQRILPSVSQKRLPLLLREGVALSNQRPSENAPARRCLSSVKITGPSRRWRLRLLFPLELFGPCLLNLLQVVKPNVFSNLNRGATWGCCKIANPKKNAQKTGRRRSQSTSFAAASGCWLLLFCAGCNCVSLFQIDARKMKLQFSQLAKIPSSMGAEGVQGATGKPPGYARRRETFCTCKKARDNLQK